MPTECKAPAHVKLAANVIAHAAEGLTKAEWEKIRSIVDALFERAANETKLKHEDLDSVENMIQPKYVPFIGTL